jgi:hypothetical protein
MNFWIILLGYIFSAVLGWYANHVIHTFEWIDRAWDLHTISRFYEKAYLKATADPNCDNCKGVGFFDTEESFEPCIRCHKDLLEVHIVNGRIVGVENKFKSD